MLLVTMATRFPIPYSSTLIVTVLVFMAFVFPLRVLGVTRSRSAICVQDARAIPLWACGSINGGIGVYAVRQNYSFVIREPIFPSVGALRRFGISDAFATSELACRQPPFPSGLILCLISSGWSIPTTAFPGSKVAILCSGCLLRMARVPSRSTRLGRAA